MPMMNTNLSANQTQALPYRQLGFWETACKFCHDLFAGTSTLIDRTHIRGPLHLDYLQQVLAILYARHPLLRAVIQEQDREYYFHLKDAPASIPFSHILRIHDEQWREVLLTEMQY